MPKRDKEYPHLCAPNDGYDENNLWMGLTPEEADAKGAEFRKWCQQRKAAHWQPEKKTVQ